MSTQKIILEDRVKLEDIEQEKVINKFISIPSNKKVVITIPAYNEEESIGAVINEIKTVMGNTNYIYQIMLLDDGSVDRTIKITEENGVLYFSNGCNKGLAYTFKKEMEICCGLGADIIVHIDADGQYPPKYIPEMIESVLDGYDLVLGSRFGKGVYNGSIGKKLGNMFFAKAFCLLLRKNIHDTTTGFRAFTKEIAQLPIESKFTYTQEQLIKTIQSKKNVKEIPIIARKTRKSRLFSNIFEYFYRSIITILRIFI
ncbi:MAG: glycosyltransferase family 2 protein [Promethearchaeota archaeon]